MNPRPSKLQANLPAHNSPANILIDSYEAGEQNWNANFREDFKRLKGYDPLPWRSMAIHLAWSGIRPSGSMSPPR